MAASPAQIQTFVSQWAPQAQSAGSSLGINPQIILDQWGLESGFGTNSGASINNVGGIMYPGTTTQVAYDTPDAFTQAYVNLVQHNFPQAVGAGSNAGQFVGGLENGAAGSYFGTATPGSYAVGLAGAGTAIYGAAPSIYNQLSGGSSLSGNFGLSAVNIDPSGLNVSGSGDPAITVQSGGVTGGAPNVQQCSPEGSFWANLGFPQCQPGTLDPNTGLTNTPSNTVQPATGQCGGGIIWGYVVNGTVILGGLAMIVFAIAGGVFGRGPTELTVDVVTSGAQRAAGGVRRAAASVQPRG